MRPVEGTILTVVREAAEAAVAAADGGGRPGRGARGGPRTRAPTPSSARPTCCRCSRRRAWSTPAAPGSCSCSTCCCTWPTVGRCPSPPRSRGRCSPSRSRATPSGGEHGDISDLRYEVMYFLEAPDDAIPAFKDVWAGIGDSIVVVGGDGIWNCHIHTDDIGASIEAAIDIGTPRKIRVTDLIEQVEEEALGARGRQRAGDRGARRTCARRSPARWWRWPPAPGIRRIFHSLGVQGIVTGGQSMNPSTAELLEAVEQVPADQVVILPNNKNIIPVAEQVDAHTTKTVHVVPTKGITEGFAALVAYDPEADGAANAEEMAEAAASGGRRRGHPGRARLELRRRARSPRATGSASPATASGPSRPSSATPPPSSSPSWCCRATRSSRSSRATAPAPAAPATSPSGWPSTAPPPPPRCTTAASRSTRTSSASSRCPRASADLAELPVTVLKGVGPERAKALEQDRHRDGPRPPHALPAPLPRQDEAVVDPRPARRRVERGCSGGWSSATSSRAGVGARRAPSSASPTAPATCGSRSSTSRGAPGSSRRAPRPCSSARSPSTGASSRWPTRRSTSSTRTTGCRSPPSTRSPTSSRLYSKDFRGWVGESLRRTAGVRRPGARRGCSTSTTSSTATRRSAGIHLPETMREAEEARRRLVFDELLRIQLALVLRKRPIEATSQGIEHDTSGALVRAVPRAAAVRAHRRPGRR